MAPLCESIVTSPPRADAARKWTSPVTDSRRARSTVPRSSRSVPLTVVRARSVLPPRTVMSPVAVLARSQPGVPMIVTPASMASTCSSRGDAATVTLPPITLMSSPPSRSRASTLAVPALIQTRARRRDANLQRSAARHGVVRRLDEHLGATRRRLAIAPDHDVHPNARREGAGDGERVLRPARQAQRSHASLHPERKVGGDRVTFVHLLLRSRPQREGTGDQREYDRLLPRGSDHDDWEDSAARRSNSTFWR